MVEPLVARSNLLRGPRPVIVAFPTLERLSRLLRSLIWSWTCGSKGACQARFARSLALHRHPGSLSSGSSPTGFSAACGQSPLGAARLVPSAAGSLDCSDSDPTPAGTARLSSSLDYARDPEALEGPQAAHASAPPKRSTRRTSTPKSSRETACGRLPLTRPSRWVFAARLALRTSSPPSS